MERQFFKFQLEIAPKYLTFICDCFLESLIDTKRNKTVFIFIYHHIGNHKNIKIFSEHIYLLKAKQTKKLDAELVLQLSIFMIHS